MRKAVLTSIALVACASLGCSPSAQVEAPPASLAGATPQTPSPAAANEAPPALRLPGDVRPSAESVELHVDPDQPRFSGTATIDVTLEHARRALWLHGRDLHVTHATIVPELGAPFEATWQATPDAGLGSLTAAHDIPAGKARLQIDFDAAFHDGLSGLYRTKQAGVSYAFTQFEALDARRAFPCFDEPGFKIPFAITLVVPKGAEAISNSPEAERSTAPDGSVRVRFAPTPPLPTYLIAFAVGPLDIVRAPDVPPNETRSKPLPLRAIAAKGRGAELAYTVAHTGEILSTLEKYFGIAYPYDKLDVLAVPDRQGAMENAGAVTFRESLLLFDEKTAPEEQKHDFAYVVAHELAHQWFGDLVTMEWWDDLWLNESFATWMGSKAADLWNPSSQGAMRLVEGAQDAIGEDALASARQIHQPIVQRGDIENAFDRITYGKGGAVLGMFERWMGPEVFRKGVHAHLAAHRYGNATADDLLSALSTAAGRDVKTPFNTFLDQPGVPFVEVAVTCDGTKAHALLKQSRYLPLGSKADANRTWQIPICARVGTGGESREVCTLLVDREGEMPLGACPDWLLPNANAGGYYRFALAPDDLKKLVAKGLPHLTPEEKVSYGNALRASLNRATTPLANLIEAAAPLADDPSPEVAREPMGFIGLSRDWLYGTPLQSNVEAYGRQLFAPAAKRLGWSAVKGEDAKVGEIRSSVLGFLAFNMNDAAIRAEAKRRGLAYLGLARDHKIHPEAVDPNLAGLVAVVVGEEADAKTWDALLATLRATEDDEVRGRLIAALAAARKPELAARARDLMLDGKTLRKQEFLDPIAMQLNDPAQRLAAWGWTKDHFDAIAKEMAQQMFGGTHLVGMLSAFCDAPHVDDVERLLTPRIASIEGGARAAASTLESMRLCTAKRAAQEPSARAFFAKKR